MTINSKTPEVLTVLRIYLRQSVTRPGRGVWGRIFGTPVSYHLAAEALRAGVRFATVTMGHAGFVEGAKHVSVDLSETPPTTLPTCIELVGRQDVLDAFVAANRPDLNDAVLLRMDGVNVSLEGLAV